MPPKAGLSPTKVLRYQSSSCVIQANLVIQHMRLGEQGRAINPLDVVISDKRSTCYFFPFNRCKCDSYFGGCM